MSEKDSSVKMGGGTVSYAEMRMVAQEIRKLELKARRIRTTGLVVVGLLAGTAIFAGIIALLVSVFADTEIKNDGSQMTMVKKDTNKVIATTQSSEDLDVSDLVDYGRSSADAAGDPDGPWTLTDERISLIRTLSWKEGQKLEVHHVAEIVRRDGLDTRVEIMTKAGHKITIWDSDNTDNFNVMITRYDRSTNSFLTEQEVNANGDEDGTGGRGRVLVSLNRPVLEPRPRAINIDDFWDEEV